MVSCEGRNAFWTLSALGALRVPGLPLPQVPQPAAMETGQLQSLNSRRSCDSTTITRGPSSLFRQETSSPPFTPVRWDAKVTEEEMNAYQKQVAEVFDAFIQESHSTVGRKWSKLRWEEAFKLVSTSTFAREETTPTSAPERIPTFALEGTTVVSALEGTSSTPALMTLRDLFEQVRLRIESLICLAKSAIRISGGTYWGQKEESRTTSEGRTLRGQPETPATKFLEAEEFEPLIDLAHRVHEKVVQFAEYLDTTLLKFHQLKSNEKHPSCLCVADYLEKLRRSSQRPISANPVARNAKGF